jgi:hypothetical protein
MKQLIIPIFLMVSLVACNQNSPAKLVQNPLSANDTSLQNAAEKAPYMKFDNNLFDFGTVVDGEQVKHHFTFTNTGNSDLIITNAMASCGCTVPEYPEYPIKPGDTASIYVVFDSKGRVGKVEKSVTISANTIPTENYISLKGEVLPNK